MEKVGEFLYVYINNLAPYAWLWGYSDLLCVCRGVRMKFKLQGLTLLLLNIKNDQKN